MIFLVITISLAPSPEVMTSLPARDKIAHLLVYSILMLWFGCIYLPGRKYVFLGLGLILLGVILEIIQGMTGYRYMEYKDMTFNSLGVFLGWLSARTKASRSLVFIEQKIRGSRPDS